MQEGKMLIVSNRPMFTWFILGDDAWLFRRFPVMRSTYPSVNISAPIQSGDVSCNSSICTHTYSIKRKMSAMSLLKMYARPSVFLFFILFLSNGRTIKTHTPTTYTCYCLVDRSSFVSTHMAQKVCHKVIRTLYKLYIIQSFSSLVI